MAASLELPDRPPTAFALFAHCFTCGKDIAAAARIARGLTARGIGVLRFDFTGLGGSEGDFANTNFSSNVDDLVAAADYLRERQSAPALLIGHSLGGTAALFAAGRIPEVTAVVTIGAPASPEHVVRQFGVSLAKIEREGEAEVTLGGRSFRIRKAFLDDLEQHELGDLIGRWKRALLVMHAPFDEVVSIDEASRIFGAARHPKSFISLDKADHLLSDIERAQYVATTIAAWASSYLPEPAREEPPSVEKGSVRVGEGNRRFLRDIYSDDHYWLADEPKQMGGDNLGPDPYEHLLAALGACTSMTIRMYANRKKWTLEDVSVHLTHTREYLKDCEGCEEDRGTRLETLHRAISLDGPLDDQQRARLMEIADRCPVHRTLEGHLRIETQPT
ncbi:MAG: bifunctional alpha/beta hydrolase/OsmC family protein [Gemmatimonadales bacterium]